MGVKQVLVRPRCDDQSPSPPPMSSCGRYLLHRVCRFDTLAGVAIKYGVEVGNGRHSVLSPSSSLVHRSVTRPVLDS
jgi:hypothetical protein